jgi:outer membrane receptor protein involved in Fe transport
LAEITVTAQRRAETLEHAALAISALSSDELTSSGTTRVQELTSLVPSLQVSTAAGRYPVENLHPTTRSYAGFGRLQYSITDSVRLNGGLRYTRDDKSITGTYSTTVDICTTLPQPCFGGVGQIA